MLDYNTTREHLILREYGRNTQKLVQHVMTLPDKEQRTRYAHTLVELMGMLQPANRDNQDNNHKIWDDLFIISEFKLDIDSPHPTPEKSILERKPDPMSYPFRKPRYKHYGNNMELLVKEVSEMPPGDEREAAIIFIGKLMKTFYGVWNKENIDDEVIVRQIADLSGKKLTIDVNKVKEENLFNVIYRERPQRNKNQQTQGKKRTYGHNYKRKK